MLKLVAQYIIPFKYESLKNIYNNNQNATKSQCLYIPHPPSKKLPHKSHFGITAYYM